MFLCDYVCIWPMPQCSTIHFIYNSNGMCFCLYGIYIHKHTFECPTVIELHTPPFTRSYLHMYIHIDACCCELHIFSVREHIFKGQHSGIYLFYMYVCSIVSTQFFGCDIFIIVFISIYMYASHSRFTS